MLDKITNELKKIIIKLRIIIGLCVVLALVLYFTPLGDIFNGQIKKKVEEAKREVKEKIEAKKQEVEGVIEEKKEDINEDIKEVEDKIDNNIDKVEDKIKELKKLKLKDLINT